MRPEYTKMRYLELCLLIWIPAWSNVAHSYSINGKSVKDISETHIPIDASYISIKHTQLSEIPDNAFRQQTKVAELLIEGNNNLAKVGK